MDQDKMMILQACVYTDLPRFTKVFSLNEFQYYLWIYLDPDKVRDCHFLECREVGEFADSFIVFPDTFVRDGQCWIKVISGQLNKCIGKHILKLDFVNRYTNATFSLFVSFYVQNDNPDKPYVYMQETKVEPLRQALYDEMESDKFTN